MCECKKKLGCPITLKEYEEFIKQQQEFKCCGKHVNCTCNKLAKDNCSEHADLWMLLTSEELDNMTPLFEQVLKTYMESEENTISVTTPSGIKVNIPKSNILSWIGELYE